MFSHDGKPLGSVKVGRLPGYYRDSGALLLKVGVEALAPVSGRRGSGNALEFHDLTPPFEQLADELCRHAAPCYVVRGDLEGYLSTRGSPRSTVITGIPARLALWMAGTTAALSIRIDQEDPRPTPDKVLNIGQLLVHPVLGIPGR